MFSSTHRESALLLQIAIPLAAAYLAEMAMFITTKMVVGQIGYHALATVGIAGNLSFEILVILMGLISIVGVLCAQAEGSGRKQDAGVVVRQGLLLSVGMGLPASGLIWNLDAVLAWTGQEPVVVSLSRDYLHWLSGSVLPILWFAVLRYFVAALSRPRIVMIITALAVLINWLLTWLLVYGIAGLPEMGLAGAGLATTLVSWLMFFALLAYVYRTRALRGYGVFSGHWHVNRKVMTEIVSLGIPVAGLVFLEAGMFSAASILSGIIGAATLAAYEIVLSWVGLSFMLALGMAEAGMIRVAQAVGCNRMQQARQAGLLAKALGVFLVCILLIVPLYFAEAFATLFISPEDPGFDEVTGLTRNFFLIAVCFQIFDGLQAVATRTLRGLKDSLVPMWVAAFGYWVMGIGGGAYLALGIPMGGTGIWWGMTLGVTITGILLSWRFLRLSSRLLRFHPDAMPGKSC